MPITITCQWPSPALSPNARVHRSKQYQPRRLLRDSSFYAAIAAGARGASFSEKIPVTITFHPPDRRKRDRDNMIAAFKAGQDGVAMAMRRDDADFVPTYAVADPVKGGRVVVTVGTLEDNWRSIGDVASGVVAAMMHKGAAE